MENSAAHQLIMVLINYKLAQKDRKGEEGITEQLTSFFLQPIQECKINLLYGLQIFQLMPGIH